MRRMRVKKILSALTGLLFAASAHADYLRDLQMTIQKANTGTETLMLWNVYRMTDSEGEPVTCDLWFCEGLRQRWPLCPLFV